MDWIIGKAYRTRGGDKAVLMEIDEGDMPMKFLHGDNKLPFWHYPDGRVNIYDRDLDIIAEWSEELPQSGKDEPRPTKDEPQPIDFATMAAQHGIAITVKAGEMSITYDGRK